MANNRMGIRCKSCGATFLIAKTFLNNYYISNNNSKETLYDELNEFFLEHSYCNIDKNKYDVNYWEPKFIKRKYSEENSFEICYETIVKGEIK